MREVGVVCLLALLAGCGGFAGATPTDTVTPAPVPAEETDEYPDGVESGGVVDPVALGAAHYRALRDAAYTTSRTHTVRNANGSLAARTSLRGQFSADRSQFSLVYEARGPGVAQFGPGPGPGRLVLWSDGDQLLQSVTVDGETTRERVPAAVFSQRPGPFRGGAGDRFGLRSPDREAYWLFTAFRTDVRRAENGTTVVRGTALARPGALETLEDVSDPRNASVTAVLAPDGLVRAYHLTYEASVDGRPVRVRRTVRYSDVGTTRIERPSWYDEVANETDG